MISNDAIGQIAYTEYSELVGHIAVNGDMLPDWDKLEERIKIAWIGAAKAAAKAWVDAHAV